MADENLALLGASVLQCAKRLYLRSHPLTDVDLLGQYACLVHPSLTSPSCCLYYLDKSHRLLETEILYSGVVLPVEACCVHLAQRSRSLRAAYVAVSMTRAEEGMSREDLDRASRIALFCRAKKIPLLDTVWVDKDSYLPLCRYFGEENSNES